jgi:hypothetical protein
MTIWPLQSDLAAMHAAFGNPDANGDGAPDPSWVREHLTTIVPPYGLFYGASPVKAITVNRAVAAPMLASFAGILTHYGSQGAIAQVGLDQYSGCYNFRAKRGNPKSLSMHSYGIAIDLDAAHNAFKGHTRRMPDAAVHIFKDNGAVWGGDWSPGSYDPMHFQWARVR